MLYQSNIFAIIPENDPEKNIVNSIYIWDDCKLIIINMKSFIIKCQCF